MTTEGQVQDLLDRVAALQGTVVRERLADELISDRTLATHSSSR